MGSEPEYVPVSRDEMWKISRSQRDDMHQRLNQVASSLALVFSALVPGLGHLFLKQYGWAALYFGGYAVSWYLFVLAFIQPGRGEFPLWWLAAMAVWVTNVLHVSQTVTPFDD